MNCEKFNSVINKFLAGDLSPADLSLCEQHINECEQCLLNWSDRIEAQSETGTEFDSRFPNQILNELGLDACAESEALLCDFLADELPLSKQTLLAIHLEDCGNCHSLLETLRVVDSELEALAELSPSSDFTAQVLAQTSAQAQAVPLLTRLTGIDFQTLFVQLMRRPRFPIEAAFAVTVIWTSFFGVPTGVVFSAQADALPLVDQEVVQERIESIQSNMNERISSVPLLVNEQLQNLSNASRSLFENRRDISQQRRSELSDSIADWFNTTILNFSVDD